jgi:hypothetical protein
MSASIDIKDWQRRADRLMKPFFIIDKVSTVPSNKSRPVMLHAQPIITSKGRTMLALNAASYFDYQEVKLLRNWLNDWLGHHLDEQTGDTVKLLTAPSTGSGPKRQLSDVRRLRKLKS